MSAASWRRSVISMADFAHDETDNMLDELERRVASLYAQAYREMRKKLKREIERYGKENAEWIEKVKAEEATEAEYRLWRADRAADRIWLDSMAEVLSEDLENAERIAASIANGYRADAYALNWNFGCFVASTMSQINVTNTLYSRETVERILRENPALLPEITTDKDKSHRWNVRKINGAIVQGILQGESIPRIAMRIANVADMDKNASVRAARTAMTAAENAGRMDAYKRAEQNGVKVEKEWLATLDDRTRRSHRHLDGERVPVDGTFSNGLRYPGDPQGSKSEVYNCRCTMVVRVEGVDQDSAKRRHRLGKKSYEQWKKELDDGQ